MIDVVVIGAGPAGSSAAYWLARRGLTVQLLDKSEFPRDKTCGDGIAPRSLAALERMGLLTQLDKPRFAAARAFGPGGRHMHAGMGLRDSAYPKYSLIIRRIEFDDILRRHALAAGASFGGGFNVDAALNAGERVVVSGRRAGRAEAIEARLAIVAVGANMALLKSLGLLKRTPALILAARAYFAGLDPKDDVLDFYFDSVIQPGYGWVFPLGDGTANVGAGFLTQRGRTTTARGAFEFFLERNRAARERLQGAQQVGPAKGYPLRIDFATAPTFGDRMLLVGEAAGLVNPMTGEGIDFALESGEIAAEFAAEVLQRDDLSRRALREYDRRLRQKFQSMCVTMAWLRRLYVNPIILRLLMDRAARRPDLAELIGGVVTATVDPRIGLNPATILKYLFA
ncbi:MAG TPA: geranylgeranyl reductase family protein [Anaerolineae bacterium]|nr:geranylgeranyl reductase family protein [Anaerolineae bacterium]